MSYDPKRHHRKSIRLKGYDYSQPGNYFVTMCIQNRECLLGEIINDKMILNNFGQIFDDKWNNIPKYFANAKLDVYQIMPNHLHRIIMIVDNCMVGVKHLQPKMNKNFIDDYANASPLQTQPTYQTRPSGTNPGSLSAIIQNISSVSTRRINQIRKTQGQKLWQRNYWEHIIRDEKELNRIRRYIFENPMRWEHDSENPKNTEIKS